MWLRPKKSFILSIKILSYLHFSLIANLSTASVGPGLIDTLWNKVPLMTSDPKLLIETLWTQYKSEDGQWSTREEICVDCLSTRCPYPACAEQIATFLLSDDRIPFVFHFLLGS